MVIDQVTQDFPKYLTQWFEGVIDMNMVRKVQITVRNESEPWLIVVRSKRCRLDGHVITPREPECDPRWELQETDCGD